MGPGERSDGRSLYRALEADTALGAARGRVDELATVLAQVALLGLEPDGTEQVRRAIAADFAEGTGVIGLDDEVVLAAAGASSVGQLP